MILLFGKTSPQIGCGVLRLASFIRVDVCTFIRSEKLVLVVNEEVGLTPRAIRISQQNC